VIAGRPGGYSPLIRELAPKPIPLLAGVKIRNAPRIVAEGGTMEF